MPDRHYRRWLIVNSEGDVKVTKRAPRLHYNEVAFALRITVPVRSMTAEEIQLHLPEMAVPDIEVSAPEQGEA